MATLALELAHAAVACGSLSGANASAAVWVFDLQHELFTQSLFLVTSERAGERDGCIEPFVAFERSFV